MGIQVSIFNQIILNIFSNFVPNKIITCNDKDPIWMNEKIIQSNCSIKIWSDSCINKLLSIINEIFHSFDVTPPIELRSVFLDI